MITDSFIEEVITPETETTNTETQTMISREFYGMEAVAQFDEDDHTYQEGDN